jgi:hyperosmotically inducible protein
MNNRTSSLVSLAVAAALSFGAAGLAQAGAPDNNNGLTDGQDSNQPVTDTWITTKVKSELATTKDVKSMDIDVKTVDGVVTLTGSQPNSTAVKDAVNAAKSVKGVKRVDATGLKSTSL